MKKILAFLIIVLTVSGVVYWKHPYFLTQYAKFYSISNGTKNADAIVVLSGGHWTRLPFAIELFQQNYAPRLLMTETRKVFVQPPLNKIYEDSLQVASKIINVLSPQVPVAQVPSLKGGATSTFDEAKDLLVYCQQNHYSHIILVSDAYHTRRALYAFLKIFQDSGIRVEAMGAPNAIFNETNWWQSDSGISAYLLETIKYLVYLMTHQNVSFLKNY